jgi:hypothetical protein
LFINRLARTGHWVFWRATARKLIKHDEGLLPRSAGKEGIEQGEISDSSKRQGMAGNVFVDEGKPGS